MAEEPRCQYEAQCKAFLKERFKGEMWELYVEQTCSREEVARIRCEYYPAFARSDLEEIARNIESHRVKPEDGTSRSRGTWGPSGYR